MKNTKMLKKNYEFKKVLSKGEYYSAKNITAYIIKAEKQSENNKKKYLGLAVGVKCGKAYQRNRIKRILREAYKINESKILNGIYIVFVLNKKSKIKEITYLEIKKDMEKIFKKAKIYKSK